MTAYNLVDQLLCRKATFISGSLASLNSSLDSGHVHFSHYEGREFFCLEVDCGATQKQLLTLIPICTKVGLGILQPWISWFNPDRPQELTVPTWITLRKLPRGYLKSAEKIAQ
jgi:hypothetical protein